MLAKVRAESNVTILCDVGHRTTDRFSGVNHVHTKGIHRGASFESKDGSIEEGCLLQNLANSKRQSYPESGGCTTTKIG